MNKAELEYAIRVLKVNKLLSASQTAFCEAADTAVEALEKQIPRKVRNAHFNKEYEMYVGNCPACGTGIAYPWNPNYCGHCGQRLEEENGSDN